MNGNVLEAHVKEQSWVHTKLQKSLLGNESFLVLVLFHFIIKFLMGAGKGTSVVMCVLK